MTVDLIPLLILTVALVVFLLAWRADRRLRREQDAHDAAVIVQTLREQDALNHFLTTFQRQQDGCGVSWEQVDAAYDEYMAVCDEAREGVEA